MRPRTGAIFACLGLLLGLTMPSFAAPKPVKVKLVKKSSLALKVLTHQRALSDGIPVQLKSTTGSITVAGQEVAVQLRSVRSGASMRTLLSLDLNCNGNFDKGETEILNSNDSIEYVLDYEQDGKKKKYYFVLTRINAIRNQKKQPVGLTAALIPHWYIKGKINGQRFKIVDANMDGKITQDGSDAIALKSSCALPLRKVHFFKKKFYELEISEDGLTVNATVKKDLKLATVKLQKKHAKCRSLIIENETGAFDLINVKQVPAGTYHVSYGTFAKGRPTAKSAVYMLPFVGHDDQTNESVRLSYKLQADKLNLLRAGAPVMAFFSAPAYDEDKKVVAISPYGIRITGVAGESFRFRGKLPNPQYFYKQGRKIAGPYSFPSG